MSADKHKSLARRVGLLARMVQREHLSRGMPFGSATIGIHCEGGLALANADVQRLIADGHAELLRYAYGTVWAFDIPPDQRAALRRSAIRITPAGRAFLAKHARLVRKDVLSTTFGLGRPKPVRKAWNVIRNPMSPTHNRYVPFRIVQHYGEELADFTKG